MGIFYVPVFPNSIGGGGIKNHVLVFFEWNTHADGSAFIGGSELDLKMGFGLRLGGFSNIDT